MPMGNKLPPIHPGEVLLEDFLVPLGLTQYRLAKGIGVPPRRVNEIVLGKRGISADTALRLARFFATSAEFWINLQTRFDLEIQRDNQGSQIEREVEVFHQKVA
jgi:addiction module HigA family antidote